MSRALMPRAFRILLGAALLLIVFSVGAMILLRQSLLRGPVRQAVEATLSAEFGQPVAIGGLAVSIVPRVALSGSDIRVGSTGSDVPSVRIDRVRVIPRLRSLFSRAVQIEEVSLDGFVMSMLRRRDGRWQTPAVAPMPGASAGAGSRVSLARVRVTGGRLRVFDEDDTGGVRETSSIDAIDSDVVVEDDGLRFSPLRGRIGSATIDGEARVDRDSVRLEFTAPAVGDGDLPVALALLGSARPTFLRLAQPASLSAAVRIDRSASRLTGKGRLMAPAVTLDPLRVADFEAPFTIDRSRLTFEPTTFTLYGGSHRGTMTIAFDREPPAWSASSQVDRIDLGAFLDALAGTDARLDGRGRLESALGGPVGATLARTMQGRARVVVSDGVVHEFALLGAINRALGLAEGDQRDTRFERLSATLAMANGRATTDDLVLEAGQLRITLAGTIGVDRRLDLRGGATLSAERTAAAIASVRELSRLRRDGRLELPLTVSGTLDDPRFAIDLQGGIEKGIKEELLRRLGRIIRR